MDNQPLDRSVLIRTILLVGASTAILTTAFVGGAALMSGSIATVDQRIPYYILITAIVFVALILYVDDRTADGRVSLLGVIGVSMISFALTLLDGEGILYMWNQPQELLASRLITYFVSAALFCTGLGVWLLRHWREFASDNDTL